MCGCLFFAMAFAMFSGRLGEWLGQKKLQATCLSKFHFNLSGQIPNTVSVMPFVCLYCFVCGALVGWLVGVLGYWEVTGNLRSGIPP